MNKIERALQRTTDTKDLVIGPGVVAQTASMFQKLFPGQTAIIIADTNTWEVAGKAVLQSLEDARVPHEKPFIFDDPDLYAEWKFVEQLKAHLSNLDAIAIAVGSGVINDLTKYTSHVLGRKYMCVGTAASMDGYTAYGASITKDGNMTAKFTITVKEPLSLKVYHSGKEVGDSLIYRLESTPGDSISFEVFDKATGAFVDADNLQVSSSSKEVATYLGNKDGSGFVKAESAGLSTLTFSWGDERLHSIILKVLPKPTEFGVFYAHAGTGTDPIAKDREIVEGALLRFNSPFFNVYYLDLYDLTNRSQILHDELITGESSDPDIASVVVNTGSFSYTWGIYSHNAGTATITLGYGEFRRSFVAKVTEYKLYYNGKEAGNSIEYYMGTNQGNVLKFSLFDETTKSFLKTKDWKLNIIFGSTHVDVSYTDTECVLKAKSAGMISINAIDTSDGQEFLVRNFAIFVRGN